MALQPQPELTFEDWLQGERAALDERCDGLWLLSVFEDLGMRVHLPSIDCELSLAEVYDRVDLDAAG